MKFDKRLEARKLREEGMAIGKIAKTLGCSKSSVSIWVRDIVLTQEQIKKIMDDKHSSPEQFAGSKKNKEIYLKKRLEYQQEGRDKAKQKDPLHMAGCMLYWAEGTKSRNACTFSNSDKDMMVFFKKFLTESFNIKDSDIALTIHCYDDFYSKEQIEEYWIAGLNLARSNLRKTQLNNKPSSRRVDGSRNKLPYGTVHLRVNSSKLVQHIFGAIQEYGCFTNSKWVE